MERNISIESDVEYIEPIRSLDGKEVATITRFETLNNVNKWPNMLVVYVMGNKPFFVHLKACVSRLWKLDYLLTYSQEKMDFSLPNLDLSKRMIGSCMEDLGYLMGG